MARSQHAARRIIGICVLRLRAKRVLMRRYFAGQQGDCFLTTGLVEKVCRQYWARLIAADMDRHAAIQVRQRELALTFAFIEYAEVLDNSSVLRIRRDVAV